MSFSSFTFTFTQLDSKSSLEMEMLELASQVLQQPKNSGEHLHAHMHAACTVFLLGRKDLFSPFYTCRKILTIEGSVIPDCW